MDTVEKSKSGCLALERAMENGGECGALIRAFDWSQTAIGPMEAWPQSLKTIVGVMLENKFGMYVAWGKEFTQIYNDGYRPILGSTKHPVALGSPCAKIFSENWDKIQPLFEKVMEGNSVASEDWRLPFNRNGFLEECYFTFSFSPIRDESGKVGGLLATVTETTARVKTEREMKTAEKAAQKAQEELQNIFMQAPVPMALLLGTDHRFALANSSYVRLAGREVVGKSLQEAFPKSEIEYYRPFMDKVLLTGEAVSVQESLFHRTNAQGESEDHYLNFSYYPHMDDSQRPIGVMAIIYDVTDQVMARKRVEEEESLLRLVTDRLPALVSYMDKDKKYQFVNSAYSKWFERPRSEIEGKTRSELVGHGETYDFMQPYETKAFSGIPVSFELTLTKPNGEFINLDTEYLPDIDPKTNKVRGVIGVGQDVTERKRAMLRVEESEQRYRSLTDTIPQMMWTATPDGHVNYANERCLQYTGMSSQKKYGESWVSSIHPSEREAVGAAWQKSMSQGASFKEEYRIRRKDGEYRWFLGRAIPIKNHLNQIQYWIGTATDIDDQKRTAAELEAAKENAENANMTKSAFLANMSHEIRTPLGAILGFSSLLKDPALDVKERSQYIETINRNGQSLTRIIDDILDLAKVEAGQLDVEEIDFSLPELMREVVDLFKEKADQKAISLSLEFDKTVPPFMASDPTRLRQIFINIIGNAIKFTDAGGVNIRVHSQKSGNQMLISVDVKDTGRGLSDEQTERLFKPFTQADNTTTRQFGGTGLGLALSKRLSQALGGDIAIRDYAPQKGCTFVVSFLATPVQKLKAQVAGDRTEKIQADPSQILKGVKILLVDDSSDNQMLVKYVLNQRGAEVGLANDGQQAVERALSSKYDIVLMDIQMPKVDGYQALERLHEKNYKVPVIALTAHAMIEDRVKTEQAGFAGHLTKPLNIVDLVETIRTHLKK